MEEIALALFICLILALVSKRYSLPPIPFYIIAGIAIGKSGLAIVPSDAYSQYLSYLGLIFLLFYVGLEMRPKSRCSRPISGAPPAGSAARSYIECRLR